MRRVAVFSAVVMGVVLLLVVGQGIALYLSDPATRLIRDRIQGIDGATLIEDEPLHNPDLVAGFYSDGGCRPVWSSEKHLTSKAEAFIAVLRRADGEGLNPEDYHLAKIESLIRQWRNGDRQVDKRVNLDLLLTDAFVAFGRHVRNGRVDPRTVYPDWYNFPRRENGDGEIIDALKRDELGKALKVIQPTDSGYEKLREAFLRYRSIEERGGWPSVPGGPKLKAGDRDDRVLLLRKRLFLSGDLGDGAEGGNLFDEKIERALRLFQSRHGLIADGVLGASTVEELNIPVGKRVRQLKLNLERLRWLPRVLGDHYIFVNLADFSLEVVEKNETVMTMRIIVGRDEENQRTFVFTGNITYLEINPFWNVPESIAVNELIPKMKDDPCYLSSHGIRIIDGWNEPAKEIDPKSIDWVSLDPGQFRYRLRQDPGPRNPLGRVKFMFPNEFSIYLHDTPDRQLFERARRTFSHGCIRIEKPLDLAVYLLKGYSDWKREDILRAIASRQRQVITLPEPVPIYIFYLTAWVDHGGLVHFCRDVYSGDRILEQAMNYRPGRRAQLPGRAKLSG